MKTKLLTASTILTVLTGITFVAFTPKETVTRGIDVNNLDKTVRPSDDFFLFVNGNWLKKNTIPASESAWGSFNELYDKNTKKLKKILTSAASNKTATPGSNIQKIGDYYSLAMDSIKLNKEKASPLTAEFAKIETLTSTTDIMKEVAHLHRIGARSMFACYISQDAKASTEYITILRQGGLGMPDRDYYVNTDERSTGIQKAYVLYIKNIFTLLGDKPEVAAKNAATIMAIETNLANASRTKIELRNPQAQYNKKTLEEVALLAPDLPLNIYFDAINVKGISSVIVGQPAFFEALNTAIKTTPLADWKTYLRFNLTNFAANKLSDDFVNESFAFYGKAIMGTPALKPRWKRALEGTDNTLGEALGQLFVEEYFPEQSKKRVNEMVDNLIAAYRVRINSLDWMSKETKQQAQLKLDKVARKLGYPDKWKDYSTLDIKRDSYIANTIRANEFEFNEMVNKLGKPIDRNEWNMTPPTINAYYSPIKNEIVFPAGIMQPIFFNPEADDAVNYGAMGAVIGHELTHGFDDQGSQYDADGNLKNWWTTEDLERFKVKTDRLVKQFDSYVAIDDVHVKGALTLGENIADLGGLTIAYYALKKSLEGKPVPAKIDGFTAEQRFFMAWAQTWRINMRPEYLKNLVQTNPHSPGNFRANAAPSNMQEFYDAFNVKEGDKMYRPKEERAEIW